MLPLTGRVWSLPVQRWLCSDSCCQVCTLSLALHCKLLSPHQRGLQVHQTASLPEVMAAPRRAQGIWWGCSWRGLTPSSQAASGLLATTPAGS